jgi:hypothetical protein
MVIAYDRIAQLTEEVHLQTKSSTAQVVICPDGTFVFDQRAVKALQLENVHSISVCYSSAYEAFALRPIKGNGADTGITMEKRGDRLVAHSAADFLRGAGVLPVRARRYDATYHADLNTIVVRNVVVRNRRKTA